MSWPLCEDSSCEPDCDQRLPHQPCHHNVPDPVYMEIQQLACQIRQSGATEPLVKKMSNALRAYEDIVKLEKRLVHARLEASQARVDASYKGLAPKLEAGKPPARLPTVQTDNEDSSKKLVDEEFIDVMLEKIYLLPALKERKFLIPFSAKLRAAYTDLCRLDKAFVTDTFVANKVFLKVVDVLESEWIQYVRNKNVHHSQVYLSVVMDFIQEEAVKESMKIIEAAFILIGVEVNDLVRLEYPCVT